MIATAACGADRRDDVAGRLTDAALAVAARHGVGGPSVATELDLWHSLGAVIRGADCAPGRRETLLARLTDAAYQVALAHGAADAFVDLELDLWRTLRRALAGRAAPCVQ
jgi:hypothetical protein